MCNNYVKCLVRRPSINAELFGHQHSDVAPGSWRDEELWFFDDADPVSVNVALDRMRAYRDRQPMGTRFSTSVWHPIAAAPHIPEVGSPPKGMRRAV